MKKIAIVGFGREGRSVYEYLKKSGDKAEIFVLDQNEEINLPADIKPILGADYLKNLYPFNLIYRSPGVPYNQLAEKVENSKLTSATKEFFKQCPCPIVGVTGTKGKGTTCTLIYNALKNSGLDTYLVGNIGKPALDILPELKENSLVVYELSSFQLQDMDQSPQIAVMLEIFPDHLDYHKNFEEYFQAKKNIYLHQKSDDKFFDIKDYRAEINSARNDWARNLKIPGEHNVKNAYMAYLVAKELGCSEEKIKESILSFTGNEHRLELIEKNGIKFYNDSASTSPQTTLAAVKSFKEPKIVIAGGSDKGLDYSIWKEGFSGLDVKMIILYGENKNKIRDALQNISLSVQQVENLEEAVEAAKEAANEGDAVIFSPGAASFDMFANYADRGNRFKELVNQL